MSKVKALQLSNIANGVALKPYKTFPEVDVPAEKFVFRVHKQSHSDHVELSLYRSESKAWELETMNTIKDLLAKNVELDII